MHDQPGLVASELALVALTGSVVAGFTRLFIDDSYLVKVAAMAVAAHILAAGLRRGHRHVVTSAIASAGALAVGIGLVFYPGTTWLGLPTRATAQAARFDLDDGWRLFYEVRAPAPVHPGFVLAAGIAAWIAACLADWAAFRRWSLTEAIAPAATIFAFTSLLAADYSTLIATVGFATAALMFALLHGAARLHREVHWIGPDTRKARRSILRVGTLAVAASVGVGLVVGPALPGAGEEAAVLWRDFGRGSGARVTVSPLVTIKSRLVDQSSIEAFTVAAERPDYWRLTALDRFDGKTWTSRDAETSRGELADRRGDTTDEETLRQVVTIGALSTPWVPAAYEVQVVVDGGGTSPSYNSRSGTLLVGGGHHTNEGTTYVLDSLVPPRDLAAIRGAPDDLPADVRARYLRLPAGLSRRIVTEARRVTTSAETPYGKAKALQDYFVGGAFAYDLTGPTGHDADALVHFLFQTRAGYCEQFAGAYAVMARAVGLPARVAVGFTPGERDERGVYHVSEMYAHAWPEVYLSAVGWIRFEPTPGRGAPGDEAYTGIPPQQAVRRSPTTSVAEPTPPELLDASILDAALLGDVVAPATDDFLATSGGGSASDASSSSALADLLDVGAMLLIAIGGVVAVVAAVTVIRRARWRASLRRSPRGRVDLAWFQVVEALRVLGVPVGTSATPNEIASLAASRLEPGTTSMLAHLAELATKARFARDEPDAAAIEDTRRAAKRVRSDVVRRAGCKARVRHICDHKRLVGRGEPV
ncbi:MAG TPA: DUF3488 and transglutaminase-like domain-containing protein [Acidimicrobiales bacterium]|nr:DUF3488 and transglutaminase-like domain-containing protein [Acidimicrobiales bacterium]